MIDDFFRAIGKFINDVIASLGDGVQAGDTASQGFESQGIEVGIFSFIMLVIIAAVVIAIIRRL
jgi:hypothetical protein